MILVLEAADLAGVTGRGRLRMDVDVTSGEQVAAIQPSGREFAREVDVYTGPETATCSRTTDSTPRALSAAQATLSRHAKGSLTRSLRAVNVRPLSEISYR